MKAIILTIIVFYNIVIYYMNYDQTIYNSSVQVLLAVFCTMLWIYSDNKKKLTEEIYE